MIRAVRERLLLIVAAGLGGCVDREVPDTGSGGSTSGGTSTGGVTPTSGDGTSSSAGETSTSTGLTATSTGESSEGGGVDSGMMLFDIGVHPDHGFHPPERCLDEQPAEFTCEAEPQATVVYKCTALPGSGTCDDVDRQALVNETNECFATECFGPVVWEVVCGPDPGVKDACCYLLRYAETQICPGRPFLVDGTCRLADAVARADWGGEVECGAADPGLRSALAAAFSEAARFEHASVASFSRFTLELLAVGAPAALVAEAARATAEELAHARLFFGLAAHHGGVAVGPGPLDVGGALAAMELADIVVRAAAEGCIAETVSAWQAAEAARMARDPALAARLTELAEEELRHCELAWRFVRWALDRAPALRPALLKLFAGAGDHLPRGPGLPDSADPAQLRAHGMLPRADRARLADEALAQLVMPAARALLAPARRIPVSVQLNRRDISVD